MLRSTHNSCHALLLRNVSLSQCAASTSRCLLRAHSFVLIHTFFTRGGSLLLFAWTSGHHFHQRDGGRRPRERPSSSDDPQVRVDSTLPGKKQADASIVLQLFSNRRVCTAVPRRTALQACIACTVSSIFPYHHQNALIRVNSPPHNKDGPVNVFHCQPRCSKNVLCLAMGQPLREVHPRRVSWGLSRPSAFAWAQSSSKSHQVTYLPDRPRDTIQGQYAVHRSIEMPLAAFRGTCLWKRKTGRLWISSGTYRIVTFLGSRSEVLHSVDAARPPFARSSHRRVRWCRWYA